jgi:integrase
MARRGSNSFRRNDGLRALRVAHDGGLDTSMMEIIVGPDGAVTFRLYSQQAASPEGKGTMTRLHLKYVQSYRGYHYFRRRGSPYIQLPGVVGSAEFMEAYRQALGAAPVAIGASKRSPPGSISAAIADYYGSQAFRSLTGGTPAMRRAILERFREGYGHKRLATLPKELIVALLDTMAPHAARNWIKTFRHFIRWCESRKLIRQDPTWGLKIKVPRSDGHHTWNDDEVAAFEVHHPIGSKARLALALGLYTAQRRGDVVRMGHQHIRNGELVVRQQKTGAPLVIPVLPDLAAIIDATPTGHLTLLVTKSGKSYGANDFSEQFRKWCDDAGLPAECSFHGLRKAALTRLADAGKSVHQIAAVSGHKTLKEIERYTKAADQRRLAREALLGEQIGTDGVEPEEVRVSKTLKVLGKI